MKIANLSRKDQHELRAFKKKADAILDRMRTARDELYNLVNEYEDVLHETELGIEDFESALDQISTVI